MADTFREHAQELAPRGLFLRDRVSQALLSALGGAVADTTALVKEGVLQRFARTCDATALVKVGDTRGLERAPRETDAAFRARCAAAWEWHEARGTKSAYVKALEVLGVDAANVLVWNYYEDCGIPAPWYASPWWSLVTVVVDSSGGPWTAPVWLDDGSDVWSDDVQDEGVWGLDGMTVAELAWLRNTIRKGKWSGAFPLAIYVILSGSVWGDGSTWSDSVPDTWSDVGADVAVLALSHVWGEEEWLYGAPPPVWDDSGADVWEEAFTF